ncbi:MAG TPA: response regulator [Syntrophales bacterium]|nr:response regulator [Syntrophales bacterium]HOM07632.1 response regulator [Syntrophales bacterium]HOO00779.1 response regulator [Syntrophales bacterium]HPC01520.1 response regulator [Syntrophales bacterium]HPQ06683.1 response regulator [Syntrophales bacterium]
MSCNVMIVDDSLSMRAVIKKILKLSGFDVDVCYEAQNGREALAVLAESWVDVIITDLNMPEMDGIEMIKTLQADDLYRRIPVVVVSTEASRERMDEVLRLGARAFMKKPFLPEELRNTLQTVLGFKDGVYGGGGEGEEGDF